MAGARSPRISRRSPLRGMPRRPVRATHLLNRTHHIVVAGLVALTFSGLLLFTADVETFWYSRIFWIKMCLMALLVVNGALLYAASAA